MRVQKLREYLKRDGVDAMLVTSQHNQHYISGFKGGGGYCVVTADRAVLIVDCRFTVEAGRDAPEFEVIEYATNPLSILGSLGMKSLAFEESVVSVAAYERFKRELPHIELKHGAAYLEEMRMIKDETEIAAMQQAADIADAAFTHICGYIEKGMTERQIALELEFYMRNHGAQKASFPIIAVAGANAAMPHGMPSDYRLQEGDLLTLDFGAVVDGYCSDMTRTLAIGQLGEQCRTMYDAVLAAQKASLSAVKDGVLCREPDYVARGALTQWDLERLFGHGLGHGVGLQIHESPKLSFRSTDKEILRTGMVVTIEPGVYVEGVGGVRIEDMVLVTDDGYRVMSHSTKQLIVI